MQAALSLEAPYDHLISQRLVRDLVRLLRIDLRSTAVTLEREPRLTLMDLQGLGKEIWAGEDAQAYVSRMRDEWGR